MHELGCPWTETLLVLADALLVCLPAFWWACHPEWSLREKLRERLRSRRVPRMRSL